jgi:hypothetical protein
MEKMLNANCFEMNNSRFCARYGQPSEVVDGQQENIVDPSEPLEATRNRTTRPRLLTNRALRKNSSQPGA